MADVENLEEFYSRKFNWVPENLKNEVGHFNVFKLDPFVGSDPKPIPYKRRDFFKIMLVKGKCNFHFADKTVAVEKQALSFSNPFIPYNCEHLGPIEDSFFCIFNKHFLKNFGNIEQYDVFQPKGHHVFELSDFQVSEINAIYAQIFEEIESDYPHKYDVLRTLVHQLIHYALKIDNKPREAKSANASQRISSLFFELLERQFPIDENHQKISLRTASDYADHLNIHVNHLNRVVKETTSKTTSKVIAERIFREAQILLKYSAWSIGDIAFSLGFAEASHFNNFFKKFSEKTPSAFRSA